MIDSFSSSTTLLARAVRQHELMELPEAVYCLSGAQASCTACTIAAESRKVRGPTLRSSTRPPSAPGRCS